jgi:hypothetical protein
VIADEEPLMIPPEASSAQAERKKRRSTRIVQAVPLLVTGVDALGRPFQERTSTLLINCHGCRYQSKHYVLKNMWVHLEVPHPESERPARKVRAKVVWIQRPRTVRQLFQIAAELEIPGNLWGIAFPPEDWFLFPEEETVASKTGETSGDIGLLPTSFEDQEAVDTMDGIQIVPPGTPADAAMLLSRQVARLVGEAKQQIESEVRDAAAAAVAAETNAALANAQAQLESARQRMESTLAPWLERNAEQGAARVREAQESAAAALRDDLPRWLAGQMEELAREMAARIAEAATGQWATEKSKIDEQLASLLTSAGEHMEKLQRSAEESAAHLETRLSEFEEGLSARLESSRQQWEQIAQGEITETSSSQREAMLAAAAEIRQQITATLSAADASWHRHVENELESASGRLRHSLETAVEAAAHRAAEEIEKRGEESLSHLDAQIASRATAFSSAMTVAQETLETLAPQVARAEELARSLVRAEREFGSALEAQQGRMLEAAEESIRASVARLDETCNDTEAEARGRAQALVEGSLVELHSGADNIQRSSIESLHKSAEWYEKKIQVQLQSALEKGVEQAAASLREKAGEQSGLFAAELDRCSRSFVDHAQVQIDEVVKEAFDRARALFSEAAETTMAAFTDEIQRNARRELDGFEGFLGKALDAWRVESASHTATLRVHWSEEGRAAEARFQAGMSGALEGGIAEMHRQIQASFSPLLDSWRSMTEAHQERLRELYGRLGDESVEQQRQRLENISNSWMLATVTSLDHQSRAVLEGIGRSAEEKLREACAQVFAQAGEVLRGHLQRIAPGARDSAASASSRA